MSRTWSMTVGELRAAIADLPDDYELVVDGADVEDCEIAELHIDTIHHAALDAPGLLVVSAGQTITAEYDYHPRLDVAHMTGSSPVWDETTRTWKDRR